MANPDSPQRVSDESKEIQSIAAHHWHQAAWESQHIELIERFFETAKRIHPDLETSLSDDLARLSSIPVGSAAPALIATYFLTSAGAIAKPSLLAGKLSTLLGFELTASSIMDCIGIALQKTTVIAFEVNPTDPKLCGNIVAELQKLFFFHGALLRDIFSHAAPAESSGFDDATGLPDHRTSLSNLEELLLNRTEIQNPLAIIVVQITMSHLETDSHAYADTALLFAQTADRLKFALRDTDIVGRLSRDEFLIILPRAAGAGLAVLAANKAVRSLEEPLEVNGRRALARVSMGIALFPEHGQEAETLLHHAEVAREKARQSKQHYAVYDEEFHRHRQRQRSMETLLRTALHENKLELYLQPQANLHTGRIVGAEALLRWNSPEIGPVPPNQLINTAEESGMIPDLTIWVFNTALRHCAELISLGIDLSISVNVTPSNLSDPELVQVIAQALGTWGVPAEKLLVELTESAMIADSQGTIDILHKLKRMGIALSIDDFGTGYSSMAYLKKMPLDELKVDQVFVQNMLSSKEDERIVRSIIDLAHHFDLKIAAEGVEDLPTLEFLRTIGCDIAQGFLISKPLPVPVFIEWWLKRKGLLVRTELGNS